MGPGSTAVKRDPVTSFVCGVRFHLTYRGNVRQTVWVSSVRLGTGVLATPYEDPKIHVLDLDNDWFLDLVSPFQFAPDIE